MYQKRMCLFALVLALVFATGASAQLGQGKVLAEYWFGGGIDSVMANFKANADFANPADSEWLNGFDRPDVAAWDYWGARLRGYVTPPQTGDYTFWTSSDDDSEVWLSTDDTAANAKLICSVTGWGNYQDWTGTSGSMGPNFKSAAIKLEAGKRYYMEALMTDGTGGGHVSVAWAGPGIGDAPTVVGGSYVSAFIRDPEPLFCAQKPNPADGTLDIVAPLFQWTAGINALMDDVYFGTTPELGAAQLMGKQPSVVGLFFYPLPLEPGATYYWRIDTTDTSTVLHVGKVWSVTVMPLKAHFPSPQDGAKWRSAGTKLSWTAGQNGQTYDVYFGTDQAAVAAGDASVAVAAKVADASFDPNGLEPKTTYYWRVDQYDLTDVKVVGDVWSFDTFDPNGGAVAEYWAKRPASGAPDVVTTVAEINFDWGSGTTPGTNSPDAAIPVDNFVCRWTAELNVPVTGTYKFYEASDDGARLFLNGVQVAAGWYDRGTTEDATAALELVAGQRYLLVMEMYENGGGATAFLRWSGPGFAKEIIPQGALMMPQGAFSLSPGNGSIDVDAQPELSWLVGAGAVSQLVYLNTNQAKVAASDPTVAIDTVPLPETKWTPTTPFGRGTTNYWKVDVVAADGTLVPGLVSSFRIADENTDNWASQVRAAEPGYLATFVQNGTYDIGTFGDDQTFEFIVRSNPAETSASLALIGRLNFGDTKAGLKYEQYNNTKHYGATVFGVKDYDYGVENAPGEYTHLVFVASKAAAKTDLYVNGELKGSVPAAILLSGQVGIGRAIRANGTFVDDFDGTLFGVAIYNKALSVEEIAEHAEWYFNPSNVSDVTAPGDAVQGVPNDGDWPGAELPAYTIDNNVNTKFLHFKGATQPSGIQVTPAVGATIVTGLTFTTANDAPERDPVKFELSGSNDSINGPWTLIAAGDIADFAQAAAWARFTVNATAISFANDAAYTHYQVLFTAVRDPASANSMQIAEVELLGVPAVVVFADGFESYAAGSSLQGQGGWKGWAGDGNAAAPASNEQAFSGTNSVKIIGTADLVHEFAVTGGKVIFRAMQYIPTGSTGTSFFILMNQYNDPGNGLDWSVQTEFKLGDKTVGALPLVFDTWVEVKCVIDLDENTVSRYYGGQLIGTEQWDDNVHGTLQAVDLFGNGASPVYYDDITVVTY